MIKKITTIVILISISIAAVFGIFYVIKKNRFEAEGKVLIQGARAKSNAAIEKRALDFKEFIESKKTGVEPFSQDVIGLVGALNFAKCIRLDKAKFKECYEPYINDKFSQHVFTPDDFRDATKRAIEGGVQDIQGIENELAVALRQVIIGRSLIPAEMPVVEAEFKNAIEAVRRASGDDAAKEAGGLVMTEVVMQIVPHVLTRLGVTGGILTFAGANSWWTFGGSLLIGVTANAIWNFFTHPAEKIEKEMLLQLDKMALTGSTVIRDELTKILEVRSQFWQTTVKESLQ